MNIHDNSLSNDMSAIKMDNSVDFTRNNNTTILKVIFKFYFHKIIKSLGS